MYGRRLARRLDRITLLLGAVLGVQATTLLVLAEVSPVGLAIAFVAVGAVVTLFGGLFTDRNPFRRSDRLRGR